MTAPGGEWRRRLFDASAEIVIVLLLVPLLAALVAATEGAGDWRAPAVHAALRTAVLRSFIAALIALPVARLIASGGSAAALLACLPVLLPAPVIATAWIAVLGRDGPLSGVVQAFDPIAVATVVGLRWCGVGAVLLALRRRADDPAARVFTIPPGRRWRWLSLRPALPTYVSVLLLTGLLALADHTLPALLLAPTAVDPVLVRMNALQDLAGAASASLPVLAVALVAMTVLVALPRRAEAGTTRRGRTAGWTRVIGWTAATLVAGLPLVAAARQAGGVTGIVAALGDTAPEITYTFIVAGVTGVVATGVGALAAGRWRGRATGRGLSLAPLLLLNLAAPSALIALGTTELFARPAFAPWRDGSLPLILAWTARFAPIALLLVLFASDRSGASVDRAARVLAVPAGRRLRVLVWPRVRRLAFAAAFLVLALAAADLDVAVLLVPPGTTTVGVRLDTLVHVAPQNDVAAAAVAVAVGLLVPASLALLLFGRELRA